MRCLNLTLDEMERLAYIQGRTDEAALLGALMEEGEDRNSELRCEVDMLKDTIEDLEHRLGECDCCDEEKATS